MGVGLLKVVWMKVRNGGGAGYKNDEFGLRFLTSDHELDFGA